MCGAEDGEDRRSLAPGARKGQEKQNNKCTRRRQRSSSSSWTHCRTRCRTRPAPFPELQPLTNPPSTHPVIHSLSHSTVHLSVVGTVWRSQRREGREPAEKRRQVSLSPKELKRGLRRTGVGRGRLMVGTGLEPEVKNTEMADLSPSLDHLTILKC